MGNIERLEQKHLTSTFCTATVFATYGTKLNCITEQNIHTPHIQWMEWMETMVLQGLWAQVNIHHTRSYIDLLCGIWDFTQLAMKRRTAVYSCEGQGLSLRKGWWHEHIFIRIDSSNLWFTEMKMILQRRPKAQAYLHQGQIITSLMCRIWDGAYAQWERYEPKRPSKVSKYVHQERICTSCHVPDLRGSSHARTEGPNMTSSGTIPQIPECTELKRELS